METVEGINGWDNDSMFGPSDSLADVFSIQFTAQGKVSQDEVVDDNQDLPAGFWQPNTNDSIDSVDETIESSSLDPVKTDQEGMMKVNRFWVVKIVMDLFLFLIHTTIST